MIPGSLEAGRFALPTPSQIAARDALRGLLHTVSAWRARARQRYALSMLDDHILKDIGLTRADVDRETLKPFWRV
ncbi:MAG TPA: DUF1127 domain-containing protein [Acetobacteraceae bacterium]|nr:DUF1127 domain-containing protein [Acetobacteraceae bacterium]